jgi:peptidoglycan hydrolase-like protein with peptidoglycan-binding domain
MFEKPKRTVNRVFVHCSASDKPEDDDIEVIRQWHLARGFDDVGYHFFIHKSGLISSGRPLEKIPSAQESHNIGTIAICLHGYKIENFTTAQYNALRKLCAQINTAYFARISFHGHCEVADKSCPIFNYVQVLKLDKYGSFGGTSSGSTTPSQANNNNDFVELNYGDRGEMVKRLQTLLGVKVTGVYDDATLKKVKDFKTQHKLYPSGIVTKQVWELLNKPILDNISSNSNTQHAIDINTLPDLQQGSRGSAVELLQRYLFITTVDGIFGPKVAQAVKKFKKSYNLYPSDIVNRQVWQLLLNQNRKRTLA